MTYVVKCTVTCECGEALQMEHVRDRRYDRKYDYSAEYSVYCENCGNAYDALIEMQRDLTREERT